ncbi:DUF211 domain-containing protein [bacterium]|nr:DUF211 domain-containing protein [bacterium]
MVIRRAVLDVLTPHEPDIVVLAEKINELDGVHGVNVHVLEQDDKTKTLGVTIEGEALSIELIRGVVEELGGAVHSIDEVSTGRRIVEHKAQNAEGA